MGGEDLQQRALFSYLSPQQRVPKDHPLRKLLPLVDAALARMSRRCTAMCARGGPPFDRAGEAVARSAAADSLQRAQRAVADGALGSRPAVSLVCGSEQG